MSRLSRELFPGGIRPAGKRGTKKTPHQHVILMGIHLSELKLHYFREFLFHNTRAWRFDFAVPDHWLAIEIDGGLYTGGRHTRGPGYQEDLIKMQEAACLNWQVLRFSVEDVMTGRSKAVIARWLRRANQLSTTA